MSPRELGYGTDVVPPASPSSSAWRFGNVVIRRPLPKIAAAVVLVTMISFYLTLWTSPLLSTTLERSRTEDESQPLSTNSSYSAFYSKVEAMVDSSVDPCQDFYAYACGGWLESHELPEGAAAIDTSFSVVAKRNAEIINDIIASKPPVIDEFYSSCLNQEKPVEPVGFNTIVEALKKIQTLQTQTQVIAYAGQLFVEFGISSPFLSLGVFPDLNNPDIYTISLAQGGLTLPSRDYYVDEERRETYVPLLEKYATELLEVMAELDGLASDTIDRIDFIGPVKQIIELETLFADASLSNAALRDEWKADNPYSYERFAAEFPFAYDYLVGVDSQEPFGALSFDKDSSQMIVSTPSFFVKQNVILLTSEVEALQAYLIFHVLHSYAPYIGESFRILRSSFEAQTFGRSTIATRDSFCRGMTTSYLGAYVGQIYLEQVFDDQEQQEAQNLIIEIENAMRELLEEEDWMDKRTRKAAFKKLSQLKDFIGGPSSVNPLPFDLNPASFFYNALLMRQAANVGYIRMIGSEVDRNDWNMQPSVVNANYMPSENKITFPAAILQPPFYDAHNFPPFANYARIGMVMGHELSHGFDDQGRDYDGEGMLRDWWSPKVSKRFAHKADCISEQYAAYPVTVLRNGSEKTIGYVNGDLTLGENIADIAGLKLAYRAYERHVGAKLSQGEAQLFFTAFGQAWCEKRSEGYAELLLAIDPHSPGHYRVNGPVSNNDKFSRAFECDVGTPMNPEHRCKLW